MTHIKPEDAKFLESNGAAIKFARIKKRPPLKKGEKPDEVDSQVLSVHHAKIIEKTTNRVWIDWTPGDDFKEAAKNAIDEARKNAKLKPMTPIEAMQALGGKSDELEEANRKLAALEKEKKELEEANKKLASQQGSNPPAK